MGLEADTQSIASTLPTYEAIADKRTPRYSRHSRARACTREPAPARPRLPPKHLSARPAILPAPSAQSPFEDAMRVGVPTPSEPMLMAPGFKAIGSPQYAGLRPGVHQLHGVKDVRMHVPPQLDEDGNPVRGLSKGQSATMAGATAAVILAASCVLM